MIVKFLNETNSNLSLRIFNENDTIANIIIDSLEKNKNFDFFTYKRCHFLSNPQYVDIHITTNEKSSFSAKQLLVNELNSLSNKICANI